MKNILVLTSIYPSKDSPRGFTPVVHYFVKEWVNMGYNVRVIHNQTKFPVFFYWAPRILKIWLEGLLGFAMPSKGQISKKRYILDGAEILRLPINRWFPWVPFSNRVLKKQAQAIIDTNIVDNFVPNFIVGHWTYPQLPLLNSLKYEYQSPTCLVLHSSAIRNKDIEKLDEIDVLGYRSIPIKESFEKRLGKTFTSSFLCYSGIDEKVVENSVKKFSNGILHDFIYIGNLIPRKYSNVIIEVLAKLSHSSERHLSIIGEGPMRKTLEKLTAKLNYSNNVSFMGHIDRNIVFEKLTKSECFIMISKHEVFGLVYIEAMAKGCIVIAAKNEGMDGIIQHGINGFLCNAGDARDLEEVINLVDSLSKIEKEKISMNAINTAKVLTSNGVAERYIRMLDLA